MSGRRVGRTTRSSRGFTLLETIVALAVGGVVVMGSAALVSAVADTERQITGTALSHLRVANGERLLAELAADLVPTLGAEVPLRGTSQRVSFETRCLERGGWSKRCDVSWVIPTGSDGPAAGSAPDSALSVVHVERTRGSVLKAEFDSTPIAFLYLVHADNGGAWTLGWESIVPPLAIGLRTARDTLVFPIAVVR